MLSIIYNANFKNLKADKEKGEKEKENQTILKCLAIHPPTREQRVNKNQ